MLNRVMLSGNIGRTPKLSLTREGKKSMKFFLATTHSWKDKSGEWQSVTDWHRITVFRESTIQWMKDILKQGDPVYVEGKLSYHQWKDKEGSSHFTTHVVVAGKEGCVRCLRRAGAPSHPTDLKSLNVDLNPNINPPASLSSAPQGKTLSQEVLLSVEAEEEEQDIPLDLDSPEAFKATASSWQGGEAILPQKNQSLPY